MLYNVLEWGTIRVERGRKVLSRFVDVAEGTGEESRFFLFILLVLMMASVMVLWVISS